MVFAATGQTSATRRARLTTELERLASEVARIEFAYPAARLGLSEICQQTLIRVASCQSTPDLSIPQNANLQPQHELQVLDAQRELGLVPRHEYRRKRRELSRSLLQSRFARTPVLQRVVGAGTAMLGGLDEGLYVLGEFAERLYRQRFVVDAQDGDRLRIARKCLGDQFTNLM